MLRRMICIVKIFDIFPTACIMMRNRFITKLLRYFEGFRNQRMGYVWLVIFHANHAWMCMVAHYLLWWATRQYALFSITKQYNNVIYNIKITGLKSVWFFQADWCLYIFVTAGKILQGQMSKFCRNDQRNWKYSGRTKTAPLMRNPLTIHKIHSFGLVMEIHRLISK